MKTKLGNQALINVALLNRKKNKYSYSLERFSDDIKISINNNTDDILVKIHKNKFHSKGIIKRLFDSILATKINSDVIHISGDVHYLAYFLPSNSTILTIHDCNLLERHKGLKFIFYWIFWFWIPINRVSRITVISSFSKDSILKYVNCNPEKISVIHNMISPEFSFARYKFNNNEPNILHIGINKNKNLHAHIKAIKNINCKLTIIGRLHKDDLDLLIKHKIKYINLMNLSRKDLYFQYVKADLVLFCSKYEGFGFPIIEAQAVGRPVVTSNIRVLREVSGGAAAFADPYNISSITNAIKMVIENDNFRNNLIKKGRINVSRFNPRTIASQYENLYREVYYSSIR